jgi:hypothetical protein
MADRRLFWPFAYPNESIGKLAGETVPSNVAHIDLWSAQGKVEWRTRNGNYHQMNWPADNDVMPIIVAMRMSC